MGRKIIKARVDGYTLIPASPEDQQTVADIKDKYVHLSFANPRYLERHKFFFSLMRIIAKYWFSENIELARKCLMIVKGEYDSVPNPLGGGMIPMPRSISFDNMKEQEFTDLVEFAKRDFIDYLQTNRPLPNEAQAAFDLEMRTRNL